MANQAKHGTSLQLAIELEWETAIVWTDDRKAHNEQRQCALAFHPGTMRLYFIALVDRGPTRRVISLRKANNREKVR